MKNTQHTMLEVSCKWEDASIVTAMIDAIQKRIEKAQEEKTAAKDHTLL